MLPTRQTVRLLVKEMEQYFLVLDPETLVQGRGVSSHKQVLPESLGRRCSITNGDGGLAGNRTESTGWLCG